MADDRPTVLTVPTELDRQDWFIDGAVLLFSAVVVAYLGNFGWQWWGLVFVPFIAIETLTGDPAGDVRGVGAIAAGLRSKLGLRRAHEWVFAAWHYFRLAVWPVWRAWCVRTSLTIRSRFVNSAISARRSCVITTLANGLKACRTKVVRTTVGALMNSHRT